MARTQEQISEALRASLLGIDNRLDLKVGPLWDYLIAPIPPQLALLESQIETLKRFYSPNFANVASAEEARSFAINFGTGPSSGDFARATVVFYRNSTPAKGLTYSVPIGTLVQTIDGTLVYRTTKDVVMSGDYAATYFNPVTQRYEIQTTVEAVAPGIIYNIPAGHIRRLHQGVNGYDGVEQISEAGGGTEPEDSFEVAARVQDKFKGLEINSLGGIETVIKQAEPNYVKAVSVVKPTDRMEFRRLTSGPALDVYVSGENSELFTEDYLAAGGEYTVPIVLNRTATSITSVAVNGDILPSTEWIFMPDTTVEYQSSTRANSIIQLVTALTADDLVEITGYKNGILTFLQSLFLEENSLFYTDVLLRSFIEAPIIISIECRVSNGDTDSIRELVVAYLAEYIQPLTGEIPELLIPDTIKSMLRERIPEIEAVKILEFRRKYGSIDAVETISPYKNQVPIFDSVASSITVRL